MSLLATLPWLVVPLAGQTLDDLRESVRAAARSSHYAAFLAGFLGLTGEAELSSARLQVDDDVGTEIGIVTYPLQREVPLAEGGLRLRLEGDFGYAKARFTIDDAYAGQLPGLETRVKSRFEALGGFLGAGLVVPLGPVSVTPLLAAGIAHVENETYYQGPGAGVTAALFDGIVFNWDSTYAVYGGGLRLQHCDLDWGGVRVRPVLRYDLRRTDPLSADDPIQDDATTYQWLVARCDFDGDTGWQVGGRSVRWTGELGYKRFLDEVGELLGFDDYFEFGLGLRWNCGAVLPVLGECGLGGSVIVGEDVRGWTFGMSASF
ncbi:MAG: hypothetical protein KF830_17205 [Planctomycetes bacterium]|nr:hypothetical protein [Planctomycetota bacterium]